MNKNKFGTLQKGEDGYLVRFERLLNHPIEEVWEAITHPDKLEKWVCQGRDSKAGCE